MKAKELIRISILGLLVAFLPSCNYDVQKNGAGGEVPDLTKSALDFSLIQSLIFAPGSAGHCIDCHQNYNSYNAVKNELRAISAAINSNRMPKTGGPLSDSLKQTLQAWIDAGAPEKATQAPKDPEPIVLQPNWKSVSENILFPRCLICHNPQGQAKFLDLSSRQVIFQARDRIFGEGAGKKLLDFDSPQNSYLLDVIQDPNEPMPPISSNIPRLNAEEIQVLADWIGLGLP